MGWAFVVGFVIYVLVTVFIPVGIVTVTAFLLGRLVVRRPPHMFGRVEGIGESLDPLR